MQNKDLLSILSYPKKAYNQNPSIIFVSFSGPIWTLIGASFLAFSILHYFDNARNSAKSQTRSNRKFKLNFNKFISSCIMVYSLLLAPGTVSWRSRKPYRRSNLKDPLFLWIFSAFILRLLFSKDITALMLAKTELKIEHFDQLHKDFKLLLESEAKRS